MVWYAQGDERPRALMPLNIPHFTRNSPQGGAMVVPKRTKLLVTLLHLCSHG